MLRVIFIITILPVLFSCNKENPTKEKIENSKTESKSDDTETDTTMTVEEEFSSSLVQNIMGEDGDGDLEVYLEEQIYPLVSKSGKVTLDRISSSVYLLTYDDNGTMRNFLIQKFYNPVKDEFVFEKNETQNNAVQQFVK